MSSTCPFLSDNYKEFQRANNRVIQRQMPMGSPIIPNEKSIGMVVVLYYSIILLEPGHKAQARNGIEGRCELVCSPHDSRHWNTALVTNNSIVSSSTINFPSNSDSSLVSFPLSNTLFFFLTVVFIQPFPRYPPPQRNRSTRPSYSTSASHPPLRSILWPFSITGQAYTLSHFIRRYHRSRHGRSDFCSRPGGLPLGARSILTKLRSSQTQRGHRLAMA
jgi:hypothetical protein